MKGSGDASEQAQPEGARTSDELDQDGAITCHHRIDSVYRPVGRRRAPALGLELRRQHGAQPVERTADRSRRRAPGLDAKEFPGLQRYAGQAVDNGPKAKAYADQFIKTHL